MSKFRWDFYKKKFCLKVKNTVEILEDFCNYRLNFYSIRKQGIIKFLEEDLKYLKNKIRFINRSSSFAAIQLVDPNMTMMINYKWDVVACKTQVTGTAAAA